MPRIPASVLLPFLLAVLACQPAPPSASTPQVRLGPGEPALKLVPITRQLEQPVYVTHAGDGSGRLFVVEKKGRIKTLRSGEPAETLFLDLTSIVNASGSEQGLLSIAFHPRYATNGFFWVAYTDRRGNVELARYRVSSSNPDEADPGSQLVVMNVEKPKDWHNGGQVLFGPDGYLYFGVGDGGVPNDPQGNAQNRSKLLGKLMRLDVDQGSPYTVPADNPFVAERDARPEIWSYGLRNPWRFSFDRATGDLYIGDVGQKDIEEINFQAAGAGGLNYGWNHMDGKRCVRDGRECEASRYVNPVVEYEHTLGCAVIGGSVYRGSSFPRLNGLYFYGDFCTGRIWALQQTAPGAWRSQELLDTDLAISSFGEDESGDLYLTSLGDGALYKLTAP